ncbi:hypothetical protein [Planktothrix sp. FACHB-1355]|uniref:hypothetical protein n=1 Tax=Planktothrix sp. FACHB-1355 TaxID=2692854 RepID=UPI001A7E4E1D|nr:hypothetical protein [Planktothrix sp. FACHB-1355]
MRDIIAFRDLNFCEDAQGIPGNFLNCMDYLGQENPRFVTARPFLENKDRS